MAEAQVLNRQVPAASAKAMKHRSRVGLRTGTAIFFTCAIVSTGIFYGCGSSQSQGKANGGDNMEEVAVKKPKGTGAPQKFTEKPAEQSFMKTVPAKTDSSQESQQIVLSPNAKKLMEKRIKELDAEERKYPAPGVTKYDPPVTVEYLQFLLKETGFIGHELFLYRSALEGDAKSVDDFRRRILELGRTYREQTRAEEIIRKFEETTRVK